MNAVLLHKFFFFFEVFTSVFGEKLQEQVEKLLSRYETGEILWKNLDVMKEAKVWQKWLLRLLGSWKIKRRNTWRRKNKNKTELAVFALVSSGNSSSTLEECGETSERPLKKRKQNSQEAPLKNGMEDSSVSFSKSKKKKCFSKRELVSSDLEETAGSGSPSKRNKSFPKVEPVGDSEESGNWRVPKKKRTCSSKEEPLSSGPEESAASQSGEPKKKKHLQKLFQKN